MTGPCGALGSCTLGTIGGTGTVDTPLARALITGEEPDDRLEAGDAGARPGGARPRRALPALCAAPGQAGAAGHRVPLGRGPGLVRRPSDAGLERHPQRPDAALG